MAHKLFDRLALAFCLLAPTTGTAWFFAPYDLEAPAGPIRLAIYLILLVGAWGITAFYCRLLLNSRDGLAPVWSVVVFYVELFFSVMVAGIAAIVVVRMAHPDAGPWEAELILRVSYGLIGGSAVSTLAGAVVAWYGYRRRLLGRRIEWYPGSAKRAKADA